jgi:hypothetical protein
MDIEEDIKILQEFTELDRKLRNYKVESDYDNFCERRCVAIDHILAEREEDKKRIERLQVLEDDLKDKRIVYVDTPEFEEKFIPKQKVKDKIEEIKEDKESKYFDKFLMTRDIDYAIEILEELLEDK